MVVAANCIYHCGGVWRVRARDHFKLGTREAAATHNCSAGLLRLYATCVIPINMRKEVSAKQCARDTAVAIVCLACAALTVWCVVSVATSLPDAATPTLAPGQAAVQLAERTCPDHVCDAVYAVGREYLEHRCSTDEPLRQCIRETGSLCSLGSCERQGTACIAALQPADNVFSCDCTCK